MLKYIKKPVKIIVAFTILVYSFLFITNSIIKADDINTNIMGPSIVTKESAINLFKTTKPTEYNSNPSYYNEIINKYYELAPIYGIRPEVALVQSFHETGWLRFGGDAKKEWNNFCGLGIGPVTNSLNGVDPSKVYIVDYIAKDGTAKQGIAFYSIEAGVEAHLQHIISYTRKGIVTKNNLTSTYSRALLDPRYDFNALSAVTIYDLSGTWAVPGLTYGNSIVNILVKLPTYTSTQYIDYNPENGLYLIDNTYSELRLENSGTDLIQNTKDVNNTQLWNIEKQSDDSYKILWAQTGKALTNSNGVVTLADWTGGNIQKWYFYISPEGKVKIVSKDGKVLDLVNLSQEIGIKFKTTQGQYQVNQEFTIKRLEISSSQYFDYNLSNGLYVIDNVYSGWRLEGNGIDLIQNAKDNNTQLWNLEKQNDGSYKILWVKTGKALTNANGVVTLADWTGGNTQNWYFYISPEGKVKIVSQNGSVLDLVNLSQERGEKFKTTTGVYQVNQEFKITKVLKTGVYTIQNSINDKVIDVPSVNPRNGVALQQYFYNGSIAQKIKLVKLTNGYYSLVAISSGKALTVTSNNEGDRVYQWYEQPNNLNKMWQLISSSDGVYIKNVGSNKYINVSDDALIQSNTPLKWKLNFVSDIPNDKEKITGITGKLIIIDPGHGANDSGYYDPGASGNGLSEYTINYSYAIALKSKLEAAGASVVLTHNEPGNYLLGLRERAYLANLVNADIFISIHCNASPSSNSNGAETYFYYPDISDDPYYTQRDPRIIDSMLLANCIQPLMASGGGMNNNGIKGADFAVVRETAMPSVLLELGFLTNSSDASKIANNKNSIVNGIYNGIGNYFKSVFK